MIILIFYQPNGSMRGLRTFEFFVMALVLAVVICFCIQLSLIQNTTPGEVFLGYLPSRFLIEQKASTKPVVFLAPRSCLTAFTSVPASCSPGFVTSMRSSGSFPGAVVCCILSGRWRGEGHHIPSMRAIRYSLKYSIAELAIALFTFALFVNSAILIVAGASLYENANALDADIFGIHDLLSTSIAPAAWHHFRPGSAALWR